MRFLVLVGVVLALSACSTLVQTSSGKEYLASYAAVNAKTGKPLSGTDEEIRKAASVEPILRFPARLGLARIEGGCLTGIPEREVALWHGLAKRNRKLGEFVPISPIIAEFTSSAVRGKKHVNGCNGALWQYGARRGIGETVSTIRFGAARQHVDAVLIYEVGSTSRNENTPLAFADVSIIGGALLPTRVLNAQGVPNALLLDVRNGYPYGTARAEADLTAYSVSWGSDERKEVLRGKASLKVVENLLPEIDEMMNTLKGRLGKRRKARQ